MTCASAPHPYIHYTYIIMWKQTKATNGSEEGEKKACFFFLSFLASMKRWPWPTSSRVHHSNYHSFSFELTILNADTVWPLSLVPPISVANNFFDVVCRKFYFYPRIVAATLNVSMRPVCTNGRQGAVVIVHISPN